MKTFKISLIVILCELALLLSVLMWRSISSGGAHVLTNAYYSMAQEKIIPAEGITSLTIKYRNFMDVTFYETSGDTIVVREYLNFTPSEKELSSVRKSGSALLVESAQTSFFTSAFFHPDGYAEIYLPTALCDSLSSLHVQTVSGEICSEIPFALSNGLSASSISGHIRLASVSAESIRLSSVSGDISAKLLSGDSTVSTTSGDIRIDGAENKIDISTVSGDARIQSLNAPFCLNTTSGSISVESGTGSGKASSVSGHIKLFLNEMSGSLSLHTTSGDIDLSLPETASFALHFSSTSGSCSTFFDHTLSYNKKGNQVKGQYGGVTENKLNVSSTSGDLRITRSYPKSD